MAVRLFDLTEPRSTRLEVVEAPRRQDLRRTKRRYATVGVMLVSVPFIAVLVALGTAH